MDAELWVYWSRELILTRDECLHEGYLGFPERLFVFEVRKRNKYAWVEDLFAL